MLQTWKCTVCNKKFTVGEWACADGQTTHIVEDKEYLLADAPADPGHPAPGSNVSVDSLRDGRTRICNIPPDRTVLRNGEASVIPGGYVEFIRGRFSTTNPEIQYYLEKTRGKIFCSKERWNQVWLSTGQQLEMQKMELDALQHRLENQQNELLAKTKERAGA